MCGGECKKRSFLFSTDSLIRPKNLCGRIRESKKHAWSLKSVMGVTYAHQKQENVVPGPHMQLEYLLVSQVLH